MFVVFIYHCHSHSVHFRRKCLVHDSLSYYPERPRMPKTRFRRSSDVGNNCTIRYSVPVVWHIIMDSAKRGDIPEQSVKDAMDVLNGKSFF